MSYWLTKMSIPVEIGSNITLNAILNEIPGELSMFSKAIVSTLFRGDISKKRTEVYHSDIKE